MNEQKASHHRTLAIAVFVALTVILLGGIERAEAQWTNGTNINNTNTGNVGVGTSTPGYKLDILSSINIIARFGTTSAADSQLLIDAPSGYNSNLTLQHAGISKWYLGNRASNHRFSFIESTGTNEVFSILQNGNVGIGTTNPGELLHVRKDQNTNTSILLENQTAGTAANTRIMVKNGTGGINQIGIYSASTTPYGAVAASDAYLYSNSAGLNLMVDNLDGIIKFSTGGNSERLRIDKNGNVGIGTTSPGYKLDVNGEINATGLRINGTPISSGAVSSVFGRTGPVVAATNDYTWAQINKSTSSLADLTTRSAGDLSSGTLPDARFPTTLPAVSGVSLTNLNASNLASGTVSTARLGSGTADSTNFLRGDNTWAVPSGGQWTNGSNSIYYNVGNVGIGTTNPGSKLHLVSGSANTTSLLSLDTGVYGGTQFQVGGTTNNESYLNMAVYRGGTYTTRFSVSNYGHVLLQPGGEGNVGIGTTDPGAKLEVSGNINVTGTGNINAAGTITGGNIVAKYQDVAEWVESSQTLAAGTVVVLDQTKSNQVIASSQAYDTRVAGVISEQPGIALGEAGTNKVLVATTGRVRIKVEASRGPILVGDLLVTSDVAGVAMKSQPIDVGGVQIHRPGTLIGKALEPLANGKGEILVLLSLQ